MAAIVTSGQRKRWTVCSQARTNRAGETRIQKADTTAAKKIPVPVAESQTMLSFASSTLGSGTIGFVRMTASWRPGTGQLAETEFSTFLTSGRPQRNTKTVKRTQGIQAEKTVPRTVDGFFVATFNA